MCLDDDHHDDDKVLKGGNNNIYVYGSKVAANTDY